jgi:hypothetical protein
MMFSFSICRLVLLVSAACSAMTSAELTVNLGGAGDYVILAKSGISTLPSSKITGNIAVSPIVATAMTGFSLILDPTTQQFSKSTQVTGQAHAASYGAPISAALTTAVGAMGAAYTDAASRLNPDADRTNVGGGILGGVYGGPTKPLTPGVYTFVSNVRLDGDVHFSGAGVFIIQMTENLVQAANCNVILEDGARPENIFWQVAGFVQVGADAHMEGIILAKTKVDFITGSSLNGRVLTQTACNLQMTTIIEPDTEPIDDFVSFFKWELKTDYSALELFEDFADILKNHADLFVESYNDLQLTGYDDPFGRRMYSAIFIAPGGRRLDHPQQESRQLQKNPLLFLQVSGYCRGCGSDFSFTKNQVVGRHRKLQLLQPDEPTDDWSEFPPQPQVPTESDMFDRYVYLLSSSESSSAKYGSIELVDLKEVSNPQ